MFFKHEKPVVVAFSSQIDRLRRAGFTVSDAPAGATLVVRDHYAALLAQDASGDAVIRAAGLALQGEVAELTDLGYQKIFLTAGGKSVPAVAEHLHGLHDFTEDLREAAGLTSLYNEGLGTTNEKHLYDRITARDSGHQPKPWQRG
ncbi:MAG: hypothetical protein P4K98_02180 [Bryobacteraceae bacterium]|nr:hypothetical protein [Bryobacteraceae bacterium]